MHDEGRGYDRPDNDARCSRPGSKNKHSLILAALEKNGEKEGLLRKGLELAMAGNVTMLQFFLSRLLPRERTIRIDLPKIEFADDAVEALGAIVRAVSEESITPSEGADLANLVNSYTRAVDVADLVKRIDALEARINGSEIG